MCRYKNFEELIKDIDSRFADKICFYAEECGKKKGITFHEFVLLVKNKVLLFSKMTFVCAGLYAKSSIDWICSVFALAISGKRVVLFSPYYDNAKLQELIDKTGVEFLLVDDVSGKLKEYSGKELKLFSPNSFKCEDECRGKLLFFTSGTTGKNKAVVLSQKSLLDCAWNGQQMLSCSCNDIVLSILNLDHVFGFVCSMLWPLCFGAAVAVGRGREHLIDDPFFFEPTIIPVIPGILKKLLTTGSLGQSIRTVLVGASPCSSELLDEIRRCGKEVRFGYGLTETCSGVAISLRGEDSYAMAVCPDVKISLSEEGEILISSPYLMDGYFNDKLNTDKALHDNVFCTGDIGVFDSNNRLSVIGKKDDMLVLPGGERIYCVKWETKLSIMLNAETALTMNNGVLTAVVKSTVISEEAAWKIIQKFNSTLEEGCRIEACKMRYTEFPRTITGKLQRWLIN